MGRGEQKEACIWIPPDPFCVLPYNQSVYPHYTAVINLRHEHNSMLNAESPSSKSPNVGVVLRSLKPFRTSGTAPQWRALGLSNRHPGWLFLKSTFQPAERRKGTKEILSPTGI